MTAENRERLQRALHIILEIEEEECLEELIAMTSKFLEALKRKGRSDEVELGVIEESRLALSVLQSLNDLSGPENAVVAAFYLVVQFDMEEFPARQISGLLETHNRAIKNITTTLEGARKKGWINEHDPGKGAHKTYSLANDGFVAARRLIAENL